MKQLSDEAINKSYKIAEDASHYLTSNIEGKRAIARKAEDERDKEWIKWGEEYCQSGSHTDNDVGNDMFPIPRRDCHYCWQELKSEEGR